MTIQSTDRARVSLTEIELLAWLGQAAPQESLEYHRGFLALDRMATFSLLTDAQIRELSGVADLAIHAAEIGIADLVQRRIGPDRFSYVIVARTRASSALPAQLHIPHASQAGALAHAA